MRMRHCVVLSLWPKHPSRKESGEKSHLLKSKHRPVERGETRAPSPSHQCTGSNKNQASSHSLTTYTQHTSLVQHLSTSPSLIQAVAPSPSSFSPAEGQRPTCTGFQQTASTTLKPAIKLTLVYKIPHVAIDHFELSAEEKKIKSTNSPVLPKNM